MIKKIMMQKYNAPCASDFDFCSKRVTFILETTKRVVETEKSYTFATNFT